MWLKPKTAWEMPDFRPAPVQSAVPACHFTFTVTLTGVENHDKEPLFWLGTLIRVSLIGFLSWVGCQLWTIANKFHCVNMLLLSKASPNRCACHISPGDLSLLAARDREAAWRPPPYGRLSAASTHISTIYWFVTCRLKEVWIIKITSYYSSDSGISSFSHVDILSSLDGQRCF